MATTFPNGTKPRLYTVLQCPPEELLSGLVDIIVNALDEIDSLGSQITEISSSGESVYASLNINNQYSRTSKSGVQGDKSQRLRESKASQVALIERTLNYTANNQGEFTYA